MWSLFLAFASFSLNIEAKLFFVKNGGVNLGLEFLTLFEPDKELLLNDILFLHALAEDATAWKELIPHIQKINQFTSEIIYPELACYTLELLEEIQWQP